MIPYMTSENFLEALSEKVVVIIIQPLETTIHPSILHKCMYFMHLLSAMLKQYGRQNNL